MQHVAYPDSYIRKILDCVKTIALIGASNKSDRPSYQVMSFLQGNGYKVIPVNPGLSGLWILGELVYATLADVPAPYEMVDIFRNSESAGNVVDEAIDLAPTKGISVIWMQLLIKNPSAAARAEAAGLKVVMNRCPKIEMKRLRFFRRIQGAPDKHPS